MLAMLPAQQRLDAGDASGREVDLGLIVDSQLAVMQCAAQVGLEHPVILGTNIARRVEMPCVPALGLCPIHGIVGIGEQCPRILGVSRERAYADARAHANLAILHWQRLPDGGQDSLREIGERFLIAEFLQQQDEFIAAETRGDVAFAHAFGDAPCRFLERDVADVMAQRIVDLLQVIEVDIEQCHPAVAPLGAAHGLLQAVLKLAALARPVSESWVARRCTAASAEPSSSLLRRK